MSTGRREWPTGLPRGDPSDLLQVVQKALGGPEFSGAIAHLGAGFLVMCALGS